MTSRKPPDSAHRTARRDPSGDRERRVITVLFCDVVGSTSMAEQMDPEDWTEIMDEAFRYMTAPVERYGGTIGRFMGDAIVAFFGAPSAHEDDPERAVRAGLEIVSGIQEFKHEIDDEFDVDFNVRVGINTGPVIVGLVGSQNPGDYTAMGDAVNVAARMEQSAEAATVQVSEATHSLTAARFEFESLGGIAVKGKVEPVPTFKALRVSEGRAWLRGRLGASTPIVGREKELAILRQKASAVAAVEGNGDRTGQIVSIIGEAGLGKSRMIHELRDRWAELTGGQGGWSELRGVSFDETLPYGVFLPRVRRMFGVEEGDDRRSVEEKIATRLENVPEESRDFVRRSADVLRSLVPHGARPPLEGEQLKQALYQTATEFWQRESSGAPTVLVLDDLHWSDEASYELLVHLFALVESAPILFLCAFRPERESAGWRLKRAAESDFADYYTEITLEPLSSADTGALLDSLLDVEGIPPEVLQTLRSRTDGNPYFVEEMVRSLVESDAVASNGAGLRWQGGTDARRIAIPENVQALLITRLDRLEAESRRTLQLAAVIGRRFHRGVLDALVEDPSGLDAQIASFEKMELIDETARSPELEYTFRHQLTRDAAYSSILRRERRRFHRRVAEALEKRHGDSANEEAHRLAYHYREGGDNERGAHYYRIAASRAARLHANREAAALFTLGLECTDQDAAPEEDVVALFTGRGRAMEVSGDYESALDNYRELEGLAGRRNSRGMQLAALIPQATIYSTLNTQLDPERGEKISRRTVELAQELGDHRAESRAYWNLMLLDAYTGGNPESAVSMGEQAVAIARAHDLKEELAYALNDLARPYLALGQHDDLTAGLEESLQLWRELENLPMLADGLIKVADARMTAGDLGRAMEASREALHIVRSSRNQFGEVVALLRISIVHGELGEVEDSISTLEEAAAGSAGTEFAPALLFNARLALARAEAGDYGGGDLAARSVANTAELPVLQRFALVVQARMHIYNADDAAAAAALQQAASFPEPDISNPVCGYGYIHAVEIDAVLQLGETTRALALIDDVLSDMRARGWQMRVYDILRFKAEALTVEGRVDEGRVALAEALEAAEAVGSARGTWQALSALARLEASAGNDSAREIARDRARAILGGIVERIGDSGLREAFKSQPAVREMMD